MARIMRVRNWMICGLLLCALTIAACVFNYPGLLLGPNAPEVLFAVVFGLLLYGYLAIEWTDSVDPTNAPAQRLGAKWGIAIGAVWVASAACENLVIPHRVGAAGGVAFGLAAILLPFAAGANGAVKTGTVGGGIWVALWSGIISGLIAFLAFVAIGYFLAFVPGFPGAELPRNPYTALEYQQLNVGDALGGALAHLFLIGGILGIVCGTVGGWFGLLFGPRKRAPGQTAPAN